MNRGNYIIELYVKLPEGNWFIAALSSTRKGQLTNFMAHLRVFLFLQVSFVILGFGGISLIGET